MGCCSLSAATTHKQPTLPGTSYSLRDTTTALTSYTKTYTYDLSGNRTGFVLTNGGETVHNVTYTYDELNRLTNVSDFGELEAEYTYDANGNRASLSYANGTVTTYSYNRANWVTGLVNTSGGAVLSSYAYTYFASGNQRSKTDLGGAVTGYVYDGLGRLTQESESGGLTVNYAYDAVGNRVQMAVSGAENYTTVYVYDTNNRLKTETKTENGASAATTYFYDASGNLTKTVTPGGEVNNTYNGLDQLVFTYSGSTGTVYAYNAQGIRTAKITADSTTSFLLDGGNVVGVAILLDSREVIQYDLVDR